MPEMVSTAAEAHAGLSENRLQAAPAADPEIPGAEGRDPGRAGGLSSQARAAGARYRGSGTRPLTPEDTRRLIQRYVEHYNTLRLHSAIGFVTPSCNN